MIYQPRFDYWRDYLMLVAGAAKWVLFCLVACATFCLRHCYGPGVALRIAERFGVVRVAERLFVL